jgi:hypothetical protein
MAKIADTVISLMHDSSAGDVRKVRSGMKQGATALENPKHIAAANMERYKKLAATKTAKEDKLIDRIQEAMLYCSKLLQEVVNKNAADSRGDLYGEPMYTIKYTSNFSNSIAGYVGLQSDLIKEYSYYLSYKSKYNAKAAESQTEDEKDRLSWLVEDMVKAKDRTMREHASIMSGTIIKNPHYRAV